MWLNGMKKKYVCSICSTNHCTGLDCFRILTKKCIFFQVNIGQAELKWASKALGYGTLLAISGTGLVCFLIKKAMGVNNVSWKNRKGNYTATLFICQLLYKNCVVSTNYWDIHMAEILLVQHKTLFNQSIIVGHTCIETQERYIYTRLIHRRNRTQNILIIILWTKMESGDSALLWLSVWCTFPVHVSNNLFISNPLSDLLMGVNIHTHNTLTSGEMYIQVKRYSCSRKSLLMTSCQQG